ncbi:MAG TPA: TonB-dependent receptor plug domain-containing protein [Solimonas sp.]
MRRETILHLRWSLALLLAGYTALALAERADDGVATVTVIGARSELQDSGVVIRVPVAPLESSSLAELLATVPGVQVRTSGGLGSYGEASLRGSSGRQVRILLDGLPLDTGGGDATSLSLISPFLLERVDVYQGRVPVGLGSGLAGTINLHTRRELAAPVVYAATLGSFGQRQLDVGAQLGEHVQLALGGQAADNDFHIVNTFKPFDPDDPDRNDRERRNNAATSQYYGLLRYRGPLIVTAHVVDDMQQLPNQQNSKSADAELDTHTYALSLASPEDARWQTALSHRYTREDYRDPASQIGLAAQDTQSDTQRTLLSIGRRFELVQDTLTAERTAYSADDKISEVPTRAAKRYAISNGIAAQIGDTRRYNASLIAGWSRDQADGAHDDRWQFEPAIGASQRFDSCLAAVNLGHRQRLPTFFERYGDRGLFKGNPALDPETANYADLGARCQPGEHLRRLALTFFGQDLHDAISPTYNAQGIGRSVNTDRGLIYGAELESAGAFGSWGWQLDGTWQHTEDRSEVRATRGKQLPGRFETQLNARVEHSWRGLVFHYAYRYEAGAYYDSPNLLRTPETQRHDLGVRGAVGRLGWSLQALNLGDSHLEQFNGYPTPGRRWLLSLSYPDTESTHAGGHASAAATN